MARRAAAPALLVTRAFLVGEDARLTTWYSVIAQALIFVAASLGAQTWDPPQTTVGWVALVAMSVATTASILFIFVSTVRIGPFRTALIMNLEPLTAMILSALVLGEIITPLQAAGTRGIGRVPALEMTILCRREPCRRHKPGQVCPEP